MRIRDYQERAISASFEEWQTCASTLIVMPTGTGKTIVMASIIDRHEAGRTMLMAHREELVFQGADKIKSVTGQEAEIEMAEYKADRHGGGFYAKSKVVVASVQTLNAGRGDGRMARFDPFEFGLLLIDEAHHATADTYRRVINHFRKNPDLKVLGVTATPDRTDEEALGQIFDTVAFDYEILDAINDGWLVPIEQHSVTVDGLDLSSVRTTAGDLNGADLARVMEYEQNLHEIAAPTVDLIGKRKALVFAASVAHAERLCEIFNRHNSESARWVSGETPKEERRQMFADYAARRFQYLVNVGVATEGFDDPSIEVVVMARPTKSRALFAQMIGRGTRPLPGIVDPHKAAEDRREAIASSAKPTCEVIDFVGNSGKHKLVTVADVLGGNYSDEAVELAARNTREAGAAMNVVDALREAQRELAEQRERELEAERRRRAAVRVRAKYSTQSISPFDVFQIEAPRERGWDKGRQPSEKMLALLEKQGIETAGINYTQARALIAEITGRWDRNQCSFKQAKLLQRYGLPGDVTRDQAKSWIDAISTNQWKLPESLAGQSRLEPVEVF